MAAKQLNPGSSVDPWLAVLFLLWLSHPLARLIRSALSADVAANPLPPAGGLLGGMMRLLVPADSIVTRDAAGLLALGLAAAGIAAFFVLRARCAESPSCRAVMGTFMAAAGALVIFFLSFMVGMGAAGFMEWALPDWVAHSPVGWLEVLVPIGMVFAVGYWSGWRYGAWGAAWGAGMALLCLAVTFAALAGEGSVGIKQWHVGAALWAMLMGAFAGARGAARFQRDLAMEGGATSGAATNDVRRSV